MGYCKAEQAVDTNLQQEKSRLNYYFLTKRKESYARMGRGRGRGRDREGGRDRQRGREV